MNKKFATVTLSSMFLFNTIAIPYASAEETQITKKTNSHSEIVKMTDNKIYMSDGAVLELDGEEYVVKKIGDLETNDDDSIGTKEVESDSVVYNDEGEDSSNLRSLATKPPKGSVDGYKYTYTYKINGKNVLYGTAGLIGVISAWASVGTTVTVGSAIYKTISTAAPVIYERLGGKPLIKTWYYKERHYMKKGKGSVAAPVIYHKVQYNFYKKSNFTGYAGTITVYSKCQPYGCMTYKVTSNT